MTDHPEVSIVIVTWNSRDVVCECLRSLAEHAPSRRHEVVVVDNGSTDGTVAAIREASPKTLVIANSSNRGLPAANNQGLLAARGDYLVISNPDVVYLPGAVDALVDVLERRPRAAFVFARLLHLDGRVQTCTGDLPTLREALIGKAALLRSPKKQRRGFWWHGWAHDEEARIGHGGESCYATRRSTVGVIGGQDERLRLDWEGIEWVARAATMGWEAWFSPGASVIHTGGVSIRQVPLRWVAWTHIGMYRFFRNRIPVGARPALAIAVAGRAAVKTLVTLLTRRTYDVAHDEHHSRA
jgi:GT2 family glycosyltransferase